ncbi:MAG: lipopolysaccharide biosynthesis protein [Chloroflexi bacterium]|nr:MAG: lipopolysaccharide biosynthesis protein [Chloroflexota bacterium]
MPTSTPRSLLSLSLQSIGYGFGILGRQLIIYVTLPFFTNKMTQKEFGVVSFSLAILGFVNVLTTAGLHGAIFRFYHDKDDIQSRRLVLGSSLFLLTMLAALPAVIFLFMARPLAQRLLNDQVYAPVIQLSALLLVIDTLVNYGYVLLRIEARPIATSLTNLLIVASQMGVALIMVYKYTQGAFGYLSGLLIGEVIGLCLLSWLTRRIVAFNISRQSIGELLRYGLPLLPAALSMWALNLADRTVLSQMVGLDQLAIYEVGYKMGAMVTLAAAPFRVAWPPFAFSVMRKPNAQAIYRDVVTYLLLASLLFALGLLAFKSEILRLLAPSSYSAAISVVDWVALAQVFLSIQMVLSIGPKISKRTFDLTIVAMLSTAVYIALLIILIPLLGIVGAAISTTIGYGLLAFASYGIGQRSYPFPLDWNRLLRVVLAAGGSYLLIQFADAIGVSGWTYYLFKMGAWLSFPVIVVLVGVITPLQLRGLLHLVSTMLRARFKYTDQAAAHSP